MDLFDKAKELYTKSINDRIDENDMDTIIAWPTDNSILFGATDLVRREFFNDSGRPCSLMNIKSGGCSEPVHSVLNRGTIILRFRLKNLLPQRRSNSSSHLQKQTTSRSVLFQVVVNYPKMR